MTLTSQPEAFILAGGASSRMGREKALLELGGVPILMRLADVAGSVASRVTVIGPPDRFVEIALRVIGDDEPGLGPLGGIATALRHSQAEWNLVLSCDLPFLNAAWLGYLAYRAKHSAADALLPQSEQGYPEPLCAMYHTRAHATIAQALAAGVRKVTDGLAGLQVEAVPAGEWQRFDSHGLLFKNMNAPEDYEQARALFSRGNAEMWLTGKQ